MRSYGPRLLLMNCSSSIVLLYDGNNIKQSISPSAVVCKIWLVSDYLVIHPVTYKRLAHTEREREISSVTLNVFPRGGVGALSEAEPLVRTCKSTPLQRSAATSHGEDPFKSPLTHSDFTASQRQRAPCPASAPASSRSQRHLPPPTPPLLQAQRSNEFYASETKSSDFTAADCGVQVSKDVGGSDQQ